MGDGAAVVDDVVVVEVGLSVVEVEVVEDEEVLVELSDEVVSAVGDEIELGSSCLAIKPKSDRLKSPKSNQAARVAMVMDKATINK